MLVIIIIVVLVLVLVVFKKGGVESMLGEIYNFVYDQTSEDLDYTTDANAIAMYDEVRKYEDEFYLGLGFYLTKNKYKVKTDESTIKPAVVGVMKYNESITVQRSGQIDEDGYIEGIGRMQGENWVADGFWERKEKYGYVRYIDPNMVYVGPTRKD